MASAENHEMMADGPASSHDARVIESTPDDTVPARLKGQIVDFSTSEHAGTIIIDTPHTYLYLSLGRGKALRYGIGVGREGFTWSGTERISSMKEWPDWYPPKEMITRQPYLPRVMAGGRVTRSGRVRYISVIRCTGSMEPMNRIRSEKLSHPAVSGCSMTTLRISIAGWRSVRKSSFYRHPSTQEWERVRNYDASPESNRSCIAVRISGRAGIALRKPICA